VAKNGGGGWGSVFERKVLTCESGKNLIDYEKRFELGQWGARRQWQFGFMGGENHKKMRVAGRTVKRENSSQERREGPNLKILYRVIFKHY